MQTKVTKSVQSKIDRIFKLMTVAAVNWVDAGKLMVSALEECPDAFDIMIEQNPNIQIETLLALEAIGRGLRPEVVLSNAPGVRRALSLSSSKLQEVASKPLQVVVECKGGFVTELKPIEKLTKSEAERVIDVMRGDICTPEQQVTAMKEQRAKESAREMRYIVKGDRIKFLHSPEFSFAEIEDIVSRHKASGIATLEQEMKKRQLA